MDVVGRLAVAADLRCRRPAPGPGGHGAHLRRADHRRRPAAADISLTGTAGELVLALYGRIPPGSLKGEGDRTVLDRLVEWDPSV
ncbi:hypothetical protein [Streptomyces sp. NBC_01465]|uniref:hypothetical protein n=1 Tax=Streptomyces sp. NBC_01465 TaxID=2903878 RepID=UPI003FCD828F